MLPFLPLLVVTAPASAGPVSHVQKGDHLFMGAAALNLTKDARSLAVDGRYEAVAAGDGAGPAVGMGGQLSMLWSEYESAMGLGPRVSGWFAPRAPVSPYVGGSATVWYIDDEVYLGAGGHGGVAIWASTHAAVTLELAVDAVVVEPETLVLPRVQLGVLGVGRRG